MEAEIKTDTTAAGWRCGHCGNGNGAPRTHCGCCGAERPDERAPVTYHARGYDRPPRPVISSVRVERGPAHDMVHVWNRGGKAGTLVVDCGDGERVAALLLPLRDRGAA